MILGKAGEERLLPADKWIMRPKPNGQASTRLFCFPFAGGGSYIFRDWPNYLPAQVEVCAVQLPGRGNRMRDPLCKRLMPLVKTIAQELGPYLDGPLHYLVMAWGRPWPSSSRDCCVMSTG